MVHKGANHQFNTTTFGNIKYAMVTVRLGSFQVRHVYGHNPRFKTLYHSLGHPRILPYWCFSFYSMAEAGTSGGAVHAPYLPSKQAPGAQPVETGSPATTPLAGAHVNGGPRSLLPGGCAAHPGPPDGAPAANPAAEFASSSTAVVRMEPARVEADTSLVSNPARSPKAARTSENADAAPLQLMEGIGVSFSSSALRTIAL